jgi:tetratricopeptide (TPR) repeat protein
MSKSSLYLAMAALIAAGGALRADDAAKPAADAAKPAADAAKPAADAAKPAADAAKPAEEAKAVAKNDAPGSVKGGNDLNDEGKFKEAAAYFEGIGEQTTANGHTKREPWRLIGLSKAYFGLAQYDKAAEAAQKAIDIDKKLSPAWNLLAGSQANMGQRKEAIATYEKGIEALKSSGADTSKLEANMNVLKDAVEAGKPKKVKEAEAKAKAEADAKASTPSAKAADPAPAADAAKPAESADKK